MATPTAATMNREAMSQAELEDELLQAEEEFVRGDYVELTIQKLDRCVAAGEWPWQRASFE